VPTSSEAPGCRDTAIAAAILVVVALVFMAVGLTLVNRETCIATCETVALTLLYAGLPVSAVFGVVFGDLVVAWPLDVTMWVVIGVVVARFSRGSSRRVLSGVLVAILLALTYGLVLSSLVEIAI
jgi:asparagine N-glycosylation enzyme membrane subunit Stt3